MDAMLEVLLTVWALSQEPTKVTLKQAFPARLQSALRRARKAEFVTVDDDGIYLDDAGCAYLTANAPGLAI